MNIVNLLKIREGLRLVIGFISGFRASYLETFPETLDGVPPFMKSPGHHPPQMQPKFLKAPDCL